MLTITDELWIANQVGEYWNEMEAEECLKQDVNHRYYRRIGPLFVVYEETLVKEETC